MNSMNNLTVDDQNEETTLRQALQDLTVSRSALTAAETDYLKEQVRERSNKAPTKEKLVKIRNALGMPSVEQVKADPEQLELNMQLALTRLVSSSTEQEHARKDGRSFQLKYNLTNEQMWTLCRIAVEVGAYERTDDLENLLSEISGLDPVLMTLSPNALKRLGFDDGVFDMALAGSCSCCCP